MDIPLSELVNLQRKIFTTDSDTLTKFDLYSQVKILTVRLELQSFQLNQNVVNNQYFDYTHSINYFRALLILYLQTQRCYLSPEV